METLQAPPLTESAVAVAAPTASAVAELVAALSESMGPALRRLGQSYLRDPQLAEDVAQEALLRALKTWPGTGVPDRPDAWLIAVAANLSRDELRRRARRAENPWREHASEAIDSADVVDETEDRETRRELVSAVAGLPARLREVVALHYLADVSTPDVAERLGLPGVTVRTRLHRGRRQLRSAIAGRRSDARDASRTAA